MPAPYPFHFSAVQQAVGNLGWVAGIAALLLFYAVAVLTSHLLADVAEVEGRQFARLYEAVGYILGELQQCMNECYATAAGAAWAAAGRAAVRYEQGERAVRQGEPCLVICLQGARPRSPLPSCSSQTSSWCAEPWPRCRTADAILPAACGRALGLVWMSSGHAVACCRQSWMCTVRTALPVPKPLQVCVAYTITAAVSMTSLANLACGEGGQGGSCFNQKWVMTAIFGGSQVRWAGCNLGWLEGFNQRLRPRLCQGPLCCAPRSVANVLCGGGWAGLLSAAAQQYLAALRSPSQPSCPPPAHCCAVAHRPAAQPGGLLDHLHARRADLCHLLNNCARPGHRQGWVRPFLLMAAAASPPNLSEKEVTWRC